MSGTASAGWWTPRIMSIFSWDGGLDSAATVPSASTSAFLGSPTPSCSSASNRLVRRGHAIEAELLASLGEVDARRLYLDEGFPSMFAYCQGALHFAESVAYKRIQAARAARKHRSSSKLCAPERFISLRSACFSAA